MTGRVADLAVNEARRWIGTPYRHQASVVGAGADCLGLFRGVWRVLYGCEPCGPVTYDPDWAEARGDERLWAGLAAIMPEALGELAKGDVLLFRIREQSMAKHIGILSAAGETPAFIHAYWGHGVVESPLSAPWARRIAARFRFPDRRD